MKKRNIFLKRRVTFLLAAALLAGEIGSAALTVSATAKAPEATETEQTVPVPKEYISLNDSTETEDMTPEKVEADKEAEETIPMLKPAADNTAKEADNTENQSEENTMPETIPVIKESDATANITPAMETEGTATVTADGTVTTQAAIITRDTDSGENTIAVGDTIARNASDNGYGPITESFNFTPTESGYYGMVLNSSNCTNISVGVTDQGDYYLNSYEEYLDSVVYYMEAGTSYTWNLQYNFWDGIGTFACSLQKVDSLSVNDTTVSGTAGSLSVFNYANDGCGMMQITLNSTKGYDYYLKVNGNAIKLVNGQTVSVFLGFSYNCNYTLWKNAAEEDQVTLQISMANITTVNEGTAGSIQMNSVKMSSGCYRGNAIVAVKPETSGYYAFNSDIGNDQCYGNASVYELIDSEESSYLTTIGSCGNSDRTSTTVYLEGGKTYYYYIERTTYSGGSQTFASTGTVYIKAVEAKALSLDTATTVTTDSAALYNLSAKQGVFYEISLSDMNGNTFGIEVGNANNADLVAYSSGSRLYANQDEKKVFYCTKDSNVNLELYKTDNLGTNGTVTLEIKEYDVPELTLNELYSNKEKINKYGYMITGFTPTESGDYSFFGMAYTNSGWNETADVLTKGEDGTLGSVYSIGYYNEEFDAVCQLEAGKTYYLINNPNSHHEVGIGDYVVSVAKATDYNISFEEDETEVTSDISMYKSAKIEFTVPEKGFYQLAVNGSAGSYQFYYDDCSYVLYSGIGKTFYFDEAGEYTLAVSREVTKESGMDKVTFSAKKGEGLLDLKEFESEDVQNKLEFNLGDYDDFVWAEFTPANSGDYAIVVDSFIEMNIYKENTTDDCLESMAYQAVDDVYINNGIVTFEAGKTYYIKFMPRWSIGTSNVRVIYIPKESAGGEAVTVGITTNHAGTIAYQVEEDGLYKVTVNGEKDNYTVCKDSIQEEYCEGESKYFFCTSGEAKFQIIQADNDFTKDTLSVEISKIATKDIATEIKMDESTVWLKYSPEESGEYTVGSFGSSTTAGLEAGLYVQTSENELNYCKYFSEEEGADFRGSYSFDKGYNYYIELTTQEVPNEFGVYVSKNVIVDGGLNEKTEFSMTKAVRLEYDADDMEAGFYHVSLETETDGKYDIGFDASGAAISDTINTTETKECDIYLPSSAIRAAQTSEVPIDLEIVKYGAPAEMEVKVTLSKQDTLPKELTLNETIEAEGNIGVDCYSFTPSTTGQYQFITDANTVYYVNSSASKAKLNRFTGSRSLEQGTTYLFYVKNTENKPYSICLKQIQKMVVYDYDNYQAFIASGGTINLMNSDEISDEMWEELWDEDVYDYYHIDEDKMVVISTKDFKDTANRWFLEYTEWEKFYKPVTDYKQLYDKLVEKKYVEYYNEFVPDGYIFKNLCDKNGNPITADTALYDEHIVFANYAPEFVYIQNITLQGVNALKAGETATLKAIFDTGNKYVPTDSSVTWSSSDNSIVTVDTKGNIKGVKAGTATITCTANDELHKSASLAVTVTENAVYAEKVVISGPNAVNVGETITLQATIDTNGKGKPTRDGVIWSSAYTSVAVVDANGVVTGKKAGTAVITAASMDGKAKADYTITVKNVEAKKIALNQSKITMKKGTTYKWLEVTFTPKNTTNKKLTWTSSNTKVATVTSSGKIKAKGVGETVITVKSSNGKKDTVKVTVSKYDIKTKKIKLPSKKTMMEGDKLKLSTEFTPVNTTSKKVKWKSSNDNIATVSSKGVVTAKKAGTVTITVTAQDGSKKSAKCTITVKELSKVKGLKAVSDAKKTATLTWDEVKDADGYNIYMASSSKGAYKKIGSTKAGVLTFTKTGLTSKKKCYFRVVAFKKNNGKKYEGKYSAVKKVTVK